MRPQGSHKKGKCFSTVKVQTDINLEGVGVKASMAPPLKTFLFGGFPYFQNRTCLSEIFLRECIFSFHITNLFPFYWKVLTLHIHKNENSEDCSLPALSKSLLIRRDGFSDFFPIDEVQRDHRQMKYAQMDHRYMKYRWTTTMIILSYGLFMYFLSLAYPRNIIFFRFIAFFKIPI